MFIESTLFNVDINELHSLPSNVYIKNYNGINIYCNESQAKSLGPGTKVDDLTQVNSREFLDPELADIIHINDTLILQNKKPSILLENATFEDKKCTYLSYKIPLKMQKKMSCLFGLSIPLPMATSFISAEITDNSDFIKSLIQRHDLDWMESECLYYFICGMPLKNIARQLCMLSTKTVEYYLKNLQEKYHCNNLAELVVKILT